ncbi:MAG: WD40 repeat domain-containing protein [Candidatus Sericytochromatia bacterium]
MNKNILLICLFLLFFYDEALSRTYPVITCPTCKENDYACFELEKKQTYFQINKDCKNYSKEIEELYNRDVKYKNYIEKIKISKDQNYLASISRTNEIKIINLKNKQKYILNAHKEQVTSIDFHPSKNILASSSKDGTIKIWDIEKNKLIKTILKQKFELSDISFNYNGQKLASSSSLEGVIVWNTKNWKKIYEIQSEYVYRRSLIYSKNSDYLYFSSRLPDIITVSNNKKIEGTFKTSVVGTRDEKTENKVIKPKLLQKKSNISNNKNKIEIFSGENHKVIILKHQKIDIQNYKENYFIRDNNVKAIKYSEDNNFIAILYNNNKLEVFSSKNKKLLFIINCDSFIFNNNYIIYVFDNKIIKINIRSDYTSKFINIKINKPSFIEKSTNNKYLFIGDAYGNIFVYDSKTQLTNKL